MRRLLSVLSLVLAACGAGPNEETLLDELRVIAAVVDPPEAAPGESISIQATVVDPEEAGYELLLWACTPTSEGCIEDSLPLSRRLALPTDDTAAFVLPDASVPDDAVATGLLWLLACEPGLCPVVADARFALEESGELPDALRDPNALLQDLPLFGVSLATRSVGISNRPAGERNQNPVVRMLEPLPEQIAAEEELDLPVSIEDDATDVLVAIGLTTGGGFSSPLFDVFNGEADLVYFAPAAGGDVHLYVVVEDGRGGSAVWRGQTRVQ